MKITIKFEYEIVESEPVSGQETFTEPEEAKTFIDALVAGIDTEKARYIDKHMEIK